jgi:hypothetical protein
MVSIFAVLIGLVVFMRRNNGVEGFRKRRGASSASAEAEAAKAKAAAQAKKMQAMAKMFR